MICLYERLDDALVAAAQDDQDRPLAYHLSAAMQTWLEDQLNRDYVQGQVATLLNIPLAETRDVMALVVEACMSP